MTDFSSFSYNSSCEIPTFQTEPLRTRRYRKYPLPLVASRARTHHFVWNAPKKLGLLSFHLEQLIRFFRALQTHCIHHISIIHAKVQINC